MPRKRKQSNWPKEWFIHRELSWLEFNDRVLREGLSPDVPLLERLKFLAIVSSNLDEFFMIRVAGLKQQKVAGIQARDPSGLSPEEQLRLISERAHRMVAEQAEGIRQVFAALAAEGIEVLSCDRWTSEDRSFLRSHFTQEILPVLTPLAIGELDPPPLLPGLQLHLALLLRPHGAAETPERIAIVPVPTLLPRFVSLPPEEGLRLTLLEDVILANAEELFPGHRLEGATVFAITRDADVSIQDEDARDLLQVVEEAVLARRRRAPVRLMMTTGAPTPLKCWLINWLGLEEEDVYEVDGLLGAQALWEIVNRPGYSHLRYPDWPPQTPAALHAVDNLWEAITERDILLVHPYESFEPVIKLLELAARDPNVLAIKQTLYRTSGDSPIVRALEQAALSGKEVTVLVELRARFDEQRNVQWARRLEDAGAHVIYGLVGLKTHAKALLIIRREAGRIRRYVHLSTGNYNDRTARLYSDIGLMTSHREIASDVAAMFNLLTGYSEAVGWAKLTVEPRQIKQRFLDLIEREIAATTADQPGLIMAKVNSLEDIDIMHALVSASRAGVKILLNVRGICCLRPGLKGVSENLEVRSIVDRYLEHARIFYFRNRGDEEVYLASADWMQRNLDRRVEILFPILDPQLRMRLIEILQVYFADNVKSYRLLPDGKYVRVKRQGPSVRAQEVLYRQVVEAARAAELSPLRFKPLAKPAEESV